MPTGIYPAAEAWFQSPIPDYYPGQTVAGMNQYQTQGFQDQLNALQGVAGQTSGLFDLYQNYVRDPQTVNPYLNELVRNYQDQMQRGFNRNVLPALRGNAIATNSMGSSAEGVAEGLATSDLTRQMSDAVADLMARTYEADAARQLTALQQMPGMVGMHTTSQQAPGALTTSWGNQNQALQQARVSGEMDRWNYYRDAPQNKLGFYANLIAGQPASAATSKSASQTTQGPTGNYNFMKGVTGGLLQGLPDIYNAFQNQNNASQWSNAVMQGVTQNPASFGTVNAFWQ